MAANKNFPFEHNPNDADVSANTKLEIVTKTKSREYMLKMLNYDKNTVISDKLLRLHFEAIKDEIGI